jgi:hypothetical protein
LPHEAFTDIDLARFELARSHLMLAGGSTELTLCGHRALALGKRLHGERSRWPRPTAPWCDMCLARYKQAANK